MFTAFHEAVKQDFSKQMSFGTRLAEERKRLGLKQAEFADLVGTDVPKQSLYENDRRELRADYLARLADAEVDIVYVLTGRRSEGEWLRPRAERTAVGLSLAAAPSMQEALEGSTCSLRDQFARRPGGTAPCAPADYKTGSPSAERRCDPGRI